MKKWFLILLILSGTVQAESPMVYTKEIDGRMEDIYKNLFMSFENNGYFVIFEPNIGKMLGYYAERFGKNYNKNKIESTRSIVFSSPWHTNQISNADPIMLALYPLHVTLIHKQGKTKIMFVRPSRVAAGSPAEKIALELEQDVIRTIEEANL